MKHLTSEQIRKLDEVNYIKNADCCLCCDWFDKETDTCNNLGVVVHDYGKCDLFEMK